MPIEFYCTSCSKLLRTPDESAGKIAKCPQCGAVVNIPTTSSAGGSAVPGPAPESPFSTQSYPDSGTSENPYSAPQSYDAAFQGGTFQQTTLKHQLLNYDTLLRNTWAIFVEQLGPMAVMGVVVFAINFGFGMVGQIGSIAAQATKDTTIYVSFMVVQTALASLVRIYLNIGIIHYVLRAARTRDANLSHLFKIGHCFPRALGASIIVSLIFVGILALLLAPAGILYLATEEPPIALVAGGVGLVIYMVLAAVIGLRLVLVIPFVVDRGSGIMESLSLSSQFMQGNKMAMFVALLIAGVLGTMFICITCSLGQILYLPYINLLIAVGYLTATGQGYTLPSPKT